MVKTSPFNIPTAQHLFAGWVHGHRRFMLALARLESRVLAHELTAVPIDAPVYVCGLARSGSTVLHHILAAHPRVASHRVKDYPLVYTPYWQRQATRRRPPSARRERAHGDRVLIDSDSPEALEEMVWMAFFPRCHDPAVSNVLGPETTHPAFEAFYRNHIRKLLLAERADRYVAKANYHIARMGYLLRLFPDARLVVPVREPVGHIGSLMRQHQRFSEGERRYPQALAHMRRSGHFEFGLDRRPIHLGDGETVREIKRAWAGGEEVRGWARYWAMIHDYLARALAADAGLRAAAIVVRYEEMCDAPVEVLGAMLRHCGMKNAKGLIEAFAPGVSRPDYYENSLRAEEFAVIRKETEGAAHSWGYT